MDSDAIPRACEGVDFVNIELSPEEGFVLSRVDGISSVEALGRSSGLGPEKTVSLLSSLLEKGLIAFRGAAGPDTETIHELDEEIEELEELDSDIESDFDLNELRLTLRKTMPKGDELTPIVDGIFVNLENLSYYDLLGLGRNSDQKQIKKAYLKATKVFHPDQFYRKIDPEFKFKLQEIFKQLNKGYKLLGKPEAKAEYDELLGPEDEFEQEQVLEAARIKSRTRTVKGEASPWKQIRVARQKPIEEKVRKKKAPPEKKKPAGPKLKIGLKGNKPKIRSPLVKKMIKMQKEGGEAKHQQAEKFYKGAMVEKQRGNFKAAGINLKLAVQYAPNNKKYREALDELHKSEETLQAEASYRAGVEAQANGDLRGAARNYKHALDKGYESAKLYHKMGELAMEIDSNFERARSLVLKAIEMEEGVTEYHMTLARAYKGLDQKGAAVLQLQKVLDLEPKNSAAAKELKALKRG